MARMRMKYILQAEAPIAVLQSRSTNQFVKTLDYLPGSTVRGAFAEIILNKIGSENALFQRIFALSEICFSDFLPGNAEAAYLFLPLSAAACKRHGPSQHHDLHDRLLEKLSYEDQEALKARQCRCTELLDRISGVYIQSMQKVEKTNPRRQLRMHVSISRQRGAALHGQLYSYDMVTAKPQLDKEPRPLYFIGVLSADVPDAEMLFVELNKIVPDREHLSIGKARTRGLGELKIVSREVLSGKNDFEQRWQNFNDKFKDNSKGICRFSITLESHLVLKDELGRPVLQDILPKHFGLQDLVPIEQKQDRVLFLNKTIVAGWNAAMGLPKPDTVALARGSVLGFCAPKGNSQEIKRRLTALENSGVGERRAEGFGQITVCHPFHVQYS